MDGCCYLKNHSTCIQIRFGKAAVNFKNMLQSSESVTYLNNNRPAQRICRLWLKWVVLCRDPIRKEHTHLTKPFKHKSIYFFKLIIMFMILKHCGSHFSI